MPEVEESNFSAWDHSYELLNQGERIMLEDNTIEYEGFHRLIESGVPELDILAIEVVGGTKYVELTNDLARVFDGLF